MASSHKIDLDEMHRFASHLAILAGVYLRDQALQRASRQSGAYYDLELTIKENAADLVTKADKHAEDMISTAILQKYPNHKIIGEESYSAGQDKRFLLTEEPTWIIDPLDGTVNYVHLFPTCCVSVGFCLNKVPVAGAIFAPILGGLHPTNASGSLYSAAQGLGSWSTPISFPYEDATLLTIPKDSSTEKPAPWLHATPLPYLAPQPIPPEAPKGFLFLAEWGKARADHPGSNLSKKVATLHNFAAEIGGRGGKGGMVHGMRSLGSAALDMVYVATGAVDIFWEGGCWEWDVCAGIIIVNETGGRVVPSQCPAGLEEQDDIPEADLGSRLYLAIRPCASTQGETATQAQDRLIREVWRRCEKLDYGETQTHWKHEIPKEPKVEGGRISLGSWCFDDC
ncbi:BZ3500_MvSof-1268-A1-R1_Chr8-2g10167 [Microbotryum saponariae]|uniref:Inositol-1-monophosphatase n=1 Tax=Microbotryum saponariae TaxID=289078 RepID=A0A2X0L5H2_9BASI|nr:BZ3500_MvSof-1268-A1-R1_Chr8-2g10167 [Microbotryum saponariae]SDA01921.1 BZ3501_MvSof-1269-A2-R1_Chr8-2g09918 [Microbotryum saponariae]